MIEMQRSDCHARPPKMKSTTSTKRLFSSLQWAGTYRSCGHLGRGQPAFTPQPSRALPRRHDRRITGTSGPRQGNMAPTMEQLRRPFRAKNNTTLYVIVSQSTIRMNPSLTLATLPSPDSTPCPSSSRPLPSPTGPSLYTR